MITLSEFFDPTDPVHCDAFKSLGKVGWWPESFQAIWPKGLLLQDDSGCSQHELIRSKIVDHWMEHMGT